MLAEPNMAGRRRDDNPQAKIIIRNYPLDTTERDLRIMFEKYGKIDDCKFTLFKGVKGEHQLE